MVLHLVSICICTRFSQYVNKSPDKAFAVLSINTLDNPCTLMHRCNVFNRNVMQLTNHVLQHNSQR